MRLWHPLPMLAALMVVGSATASTESLSIVGGEETRTLSFSPKGTDEVGKLTVVVRNTGAVGGTLRVRFVDGDGNEIDVKKTSSRLTLKDDFTVRLLKPPTLQIGAHDAVQLTLQFVRAASATRPTGANLIVSLEGKAGAGPAVVPLTISREEDEKLQFSEDKATVSLTRLFGPFNRLLSDCTECMAGESVDVSTRGATPTNGTAVLHSESGGSAEISLERTDASSSKLRVTSIDRHGTYEGKLILDPEAAQPRTLAVTVKARDALYSALLAVLAGAGLAALFLKPHEKRRNRGNVKALLKTSVLPYVNARKGPNGRQTRPDRFYLTELIPDNDAGVFPEKGGCADVEALKPVPRLYCKAAKINGEQTLDDLLAEMAEVTARFDRWRKVEDAIKTLNAQTGALPKNPKYDPLRADAAALLVRSYLEPGDDKVASELVLLFHGEAAVLTAYVQARELFDKQPSGWRGSHTNVDPTHDLDGLTAALTRTSANAEQVALALLYKVAALQHPENIPEDPQPDDQTQFLEELQSSTSTHYALQNFSLPSRQIIIDARNLGSDNVDTRSPEQIRAAVRRSDWLIFWLTAMLTALVYLAGQYSDDWGSIEDYIFAFAAGAVAPSVITWSLLPYARSYKPAAASAA